jgi:hypothetical protein
MAGPLPYRHAMARRSLTDYLRDDASPLLPDGYWRHRPRSERLLLFRRLREQVPDLVVGESYRLGGSLRLAPGRALGADERLKARLHSVFTDSADPYCVFIENRNGVQYYFRVPLQDLIDRAAWAEE